MGTFTRSAVERVCLIGWVGMALLVVLPTGLGIVLAPLLVLAVPTLFARPAISAGSALSHGGATTSGMSRTSDSALHGKSLRAVGGRFAVAQSGWRTPVAWPTSMRWLSGSRM